MLSLPISPASQIFGNSQRASARPARPTPMRNQTEGPKSPRSRGGDGGAVGPSVDSTSGADRPSRHSRTKAAASASAPNCSRRSVAIATSSPIGAVRVGCSMIRRSSLACTSSAPGAAAHSATTFAPCSRRWAFLNSAGVTISAETPFFPARPVRPDRCSSVSEFDGRSAWITSSRPGRSMPRAATSVAIHTRARPSRRACSAWVRSCCESSPDRATTWKPRLPIRAIRWFTLTRVLQNTMAVRAS